MVDCEDFEEDFVRGGGEVLVEVRGREAESYGDIVGMSGDVLPEEGGQRIELLCVVCDFEQTQQGRQVVFVEFEAPAVHGGCHLRPGLQMMRGGKSAEGFWGGRVQAAGGFKGSLGILEIVDPESQDAQSDKRSRV